MGDEDSGVVCYDEAVVGYGKLVPYILERLQRVARRKDLQPLVVCNGFNNLPVFGLFVGGVGDIVNDVGVSYHVASYGEQVFVGHGCQIPAEGIGDCVVFAFGPEYVKIKC